MNAPVRAGFQLGCEGEVLSAASRRTRNAGGQVPADRIAVTEKSVVAKHEGAAPSLSAPSTTGSTQQTAPAVSKPDNETMQLLQQAKQLDQQGKESECMAMATKIEALVPAQTK